MKRLSITEPQALEAAIQALRNDGVIAAPTETVYGLMARWNTERARAEIYRLKHRPANKQLQMLVASIEDLAPFDIIHRDWLEKIATAFWPGPLTLVVATATGGTIGVRIPKNPFVLELIRRLGEPLAATSANASGEPPATTPDDAIRALDGTPAVLIDGGIITETGGTASSVISIVGDIPDVLRPGVITLEQICDAIKAPRCARP